MSPRKDARRVDLGQRISALRSAAQLSAGRVDPEVEQRVAQVADRADQRLAFSGEFTVVALAGATGSGKSSTFNALSGTQLAEPGVTRPTTSRAMAAVWGGDSPTQILDWLQVPRRHLVGDGPKGWDDLVLIDLPDHDSTQLSNRAEAERLIGMVDQMIWVVDPQKYADAALHERYLVPMASHAASMVVVLNQIDRLTPAEAKACQADLRRLLDAEGLSAVPIVAASAVTGQGIDTLRSRLSSLIADKKAAAQRLSADLSVAATGLSEQLGSGEVPTISAQQRSRLGTELSRAAGSDVVTQAVVAATRRRGTLITGWPVLKWVASLRPDPLRRLHLDRLTGRKAKGEIEPARVERTALRTSQGVSGPRVEAAVRDLAAEVGTGLPIPWRAAIRDASRAEAAVLPDQLDRAVATTDLAMDRGFGYWRVFQTLQWLLFAVMVIGLGWLAADFVLAYFQFPPLPTKHWHRLPAQTWAIIGAVAAGLLLALIARVLVEGTARAKGRRAQKVLRGSIDQVGQRLVIEPVQDQLDQLRQAREQVKVAAGR